MDNGCCIIIHQSPIVQLGLSSIMQSLNVEIRGIMMNNPDCKILVEWRNYIVLVDTRYQEFIRKHRKYLQRYNNSIIGLDFADLPCSDSSVFDDVLFKTDSHSAILSKINRFAKKRGEKSISNKLSTREREILKYVAQGNSNKQIADKLFISIHTVITHRKHITGKLGVKSISGLTLYAAINNIIAPPI